MQVGELSRINIYIYISPAEDSCFGQVGTVLHELGMSTYHHEFVKKVRGIRGDMAPKILPGSSFGSLNWYHWNLVRRILHLRGTKKRGKI